MLTYEGEQFLGTQSICEKLGGLPNISHKISLADYQPTNSNGIIAFVIGTLTIDGGNEMAFTHVFHLAVGGQNGYYVHNDIFRLNLG